MMSVSRGVSFLCDDCFGDMARLLVTKLLVVVYTPDTRLSTKNLVIREESWSKGSVDVQKWQWDNDFAPLTRIA